MFSNYWAMGHRGIVSSYYLQRIIQSLYFDLVVYQLIYFANRKIIYKHFVFRLHLNHNSKHIFSYIESIIYWTTLVFVSSIIILFDMTSSLSLMTTTKSPPLQLVMSLIKWGYVNENEFTFSKRARGCEYGIWAKWIWKWGTVKYRV